MDDSLSGLVFLAVIVCAVLLAVAVAVGVMEFFRRRTWSRRFWLEAQPSSRLGLRTGHRVLQNLALACRAEQLTMPAVTAVAVDEQRAQVFLAVPSERAPAPWRASDDGVRWTALLEGAEAPPAGDGMPAADSRTAPTPELLVTAGQTVGATLFLNLAAAPGPIALSGPHRVRRQIVRRWVAELTEPAWRLDVNALVVGDPTLLSGRATDATGTLRADSARDFPGGLLVVGRAAAAERLAAVHERGVVDGMEKVAVVVDGPWSRAVWNLRVSDNGTMASSILPEVDWRETPELEIRGTA